MSEEVKDQEIKEGDTFDVASVSTEVRDSEGNVVQQKMEEAGKKEDVKVDPYAVDYKVEEDGDTYRTIINAPSPDLALQEFVKIASTPSHILALRIEKEKDGKEAQYRPTLLKLNDFKQISVEQLGIAHLEPLPEADFTDQRVEVDEEKTEVEKKED